MKRSIIALVLIITTISLNSCYHKSFEDTNTTFKSFFQHTTYTEIPDDDVLNVTVEEHIGTGDLLDVEYQYGVNTRHNKYYRDSKGKIVMVYDSVYRHKNGYPQTRGFVYTINNDGDVVFDFWAYAFIIVFGFSLAGWFFCKFVWC